MFNFSLVLIGVLYATFLPGFVFIECFYSSLKTYVKMPLYFISSVLISTYFTYLTSLLFGFNRLNIISNAIFFLGFFVIMVYKKRKLILANRINDDYKKALIVAVIVYFIFFIILSRGIFRLVNGSFFIMSGPNWQDTAMHLSIIESISEGNFPPQAPYFSGHKLSYYYFADLHASLISILVNDFFPQVLVIINPFFAATFFLSVYALTFILIKNSLFSVIAGLMALLYGNLGFVNLIYDSIVGFQNPLNLLKNNSYHLDFGKALQMVPMADYFLQNRPMVVGLPSIVLVILLMILFSLKRKSKYLILAGIISGLILKFQFFGFLISMIVFALFFAQALIKFFRKKSTKFFLLKMLLFLVPSFLTIFLFGIEKAGDRSLIKVVLDSLYFEPWQRSDLNWYLSFIILNFNLPIFFLVAVAFFLNKFNKLKIKKMFGLIYFLAIILILIPFSVKFTIYQYDMFKFFYYSIPLISVIFSVFSYNIYLKFKKYVYLSALVLIIVSATSINILIHAFLNETSAYTMDQFLAGKWIRENTPQKSVFLTYPSVHSPVSDIAGRLRILSYINWPYSHGFNIGGDNVFSRNEDLKSFFVNLNQGNISSSISIMDKYKADYVYLGNEELADFPFSKNKLESSGVLEKIYENNEVAIFAKNR